MARRTRSPELPSTAIYDGRRWIGDVAEQLNGQWEAATAAGESLGLFTSYAAASHALIAWAKEPADA